LFTESEENVQKTCFIFLKKDHLDGWDPYLILLVLGMPTSC